MGSPSSRGTSEAFVVSSKHKSRKHGRLQILLTRFLVTEADRPVIVIPSISFFHFHDCIFVFVDTGRGLGAQIPCNPVALNKFSCQLLDQAAIAHKANTLKIITAFQPGIFAFPAVPGKGAGAAGVGVVVGAAGGGATGMVESVAAGLGVDAGRGTAGGGWLTGGWGVDSGGGTAGGGWLTGGWGGGGGGAGWVVAGGFSV
jgi:hypothetical protein